MPHCATTGMRAEDPCNALAMMLQRTCNGLAMGLLAGSKVACLLKSVRTEVPGKGILAPEFGSIQCLDLSEICGAVAYQDHQFRIRISGKIGP